MQDRAGPQKGEKALSACVWQNCCRSQLELKPRPEGFLLISGQLVEKNGATAAPEQAKRQFPQEPDGCALVPRALPPRYREWE